MNFFKRMTCHISAIKKMVKFFQIYPVCGEFDMLFPSVSSVFNFFKNLAAKRYGLKTWCSHQFLNSLNFLNFPKTCFILKFTWKGELFQRGS